MKSNRLHLVNYLVPWCKERPGPGLLLWSVNKYENRKFGPNWYSWCDVMFFDDYSPVFRFMKQELIEGTGRVELQKVTKVTSSPEGICEWKKNQGWKISMYILYLCPLVRGVRLCRTILSYRMLLLYLRTLHERLMSALTVNKFETA